MDDQTNLCYVRKERKSVYIHVLLQVNLEHGNNLRQYFRTQTLNQMFSLRLLALFRLRFYLINCNLLETG